MKPIIATCLNLFVVVTACVSAAEPASAPKESEELRFRRVYIPEDMKDWPQGKIKYLPMEAREFERLVGTIQRTAVGLPAQAAAGLVQAEYECRLKGRSLLRGTAVVDVSPAIPSSTLVTLEPCNLAIDRAKWMTSDGAPAVLGMSSDGRLQVLAERGGQMTFDWSLAGQASGEAGATFSISLPPSPISRIKLEVPADLRPSVDHGIIADGGPVEPGLRRWTIELGGWSGCRLQIARNPDESPRTPLLVARLSTVYDLSLHGLDVFVDVAIDAHRGPVRTLVLDLERSLELVEANSGDQSLAWNVRSKRDGRPRQAIVELPPPLQEGAAKLRLHALCPLTMGESWKLPRLLVEGAAFRTNTLRLNVSPSLEVTSLTPRGCRQTALAASKPTEAAPFDFDVLDPDAGLELSVSPRTGDVRTLSATVTVLGQGKMIGCVATDFHCRGGPLFILNADVLPRWTIDSVTSQPADALDDWSVSNRGGARRLSLRLARPLSAEHPLRVTVSARRLYALPGRNLTIDDVVPLRFASSDDARRLVDLHATGANLLRVIGGRRPWRTDVKELTAEELDLFAEPPGDVLLNDDGGRSGLRFSLEEQKPNYAADIRVEAVVDHGALQEDYRLTCTPAKTVPVDRLVVHFTGRRETPLSWSIAGLDDTHYTARRWTPAQESAAGLSADEEAWDILLRNRRTTPLGLHATRRTKIHGSLPVCLASLPDAATQQAALTVRSLGPQAVEIKTHRVTPLPVAAAAAGRLQTVRAAYRYDPREETSPRPEPAVLVTCVDRETPSAWAWDCTIHSEFAVSGRSEHLITYDLENAGSRQFVVELPPPLVRADVHAIEINGKPAAAFSSAAAANALAIDLPAEMTKVRLALQLSTSGAPLATFGRLHSLQPKVEFPILARHWSVSLPPGYATLSGGNDPAIVVHCTSLEVAGWLLFLGIVGVGTWRRTARPMVLWILATVCGILSLLLPAAVAIVFSRGLLGVVFCLLLALVRQRATRRREEPFRPKLELPSTLTNVVPYGAPVLLAAMLGGVDSAPAAELSKSATETYSVFVPMNEKQEATGEKYFVPEAFFSELYRRAAARAEKPLGWMIASAVYRVGLAEDSALQEYGIDHLAAEFEIRVFEGAARVRIPLRRDEVSLVPGQAELDDRPVQPEWEADGSALVLDVPEPGEYRLLLALRPNGSPRAHGGGLDVAIPRVPTARVEVSVPSGGPTITFPSARGAVRREEMPARWVAELGPSDRLTARWRDAAADSGEALNVKQFQWLRIHPGCVLLDVRLKTHLPAGQARRLLVKADPSLELLSDTAMLLPWAAAAGNSNPAPTYEIPLPPSTASEATCDLHFLCAGGGQPASGIGTFRAPLVEVVGARTDRRWLAVSIDPVLDYQLGGARLQDAAAVAEFVSNWGAADSLPDFAFRLDGNAADWSMTTRLRRLETTGDQDVSWTFDLDRASVRVDYQLTAVGGSRCQYCLDAPPELRLDSVAVTCDGAAVASPWARDSAGRLTVFLRNGATGRHQLQLRGQMPWPMNLQSALPAIRLQDARMQNSVVHLYRRSSVAVVVSTAAGPAEIKSLAEAADTNERDRPLRSFYVDPAAIGAVAVTVRPAVGDAGKVDAGPARPATPGSASGTGDARILHADVRFAVRPDGRCLGAAAFDLEAPAAQYALSIPEGFTLLQLTADGVPIEGSPANRGTQVVPLVPRASKSRIEALFFSNAGNWAHSSLAGNQVLFPMPRLGNLPATNVLWTIAAPPGLQPILKEADHSRPSSEVADDQPSGLVAAWRQYVANYPSVACRTSGDAGELAVRFVSDASNAWSSRLMGLVGFIAVMTLIAWGLRRGAASWLTCHPYLVAIGLGVAWWLWASPSAPGLLLVLVVVVRLGFVSWRRSRPIPPIGT